MHELDDQTLLRHYAEHDSEPAFATLVARHVDKVYSAARRHTSNDHAAEEITQAVFVILARRAKSLRKHPALSGWLYETTRLTALTHIRSEIRRAHREQESHMQTTLQGGGDAASPSDQDTAWPHIAPLLDDALSKLSATDRHAIVLRYFDGKSLSEVGTALGASEDAAKKRVARAVEKLRGWFTKRGVTLTATVLTAAISANSVQAAPLGLAATVTATAAKGAVVSGSTLTLIKGALKFMAWMKMKTAIVVTAGLLLAAGTTTLVVEKFVRPSMPNVSEEMWMINDYEALKKLPPVLILRPSKFLNEQFGMSLDHKCLYRNMPLFMLYERAYPSPGSARILAADLLPAPKYEQFTNPFSLHLTNGFDLMLTLTNQPVEALRKEMKRQLKLSGRYELIETNVLLLKTAKLGAPGIKPGKGHGSPMNSGGLIFYQHGYSITNTSSLEHLASQIENEFDLPVLDRTGMKGYFDVSMSWKLDEATSVALAFGSPEAKKSEHNLIKEALLNQLGLELVPSREPVEMLVVEKVK